MFKQILNKIFNTNPRAISFQQGLDLTGLPICTFNQGDKKYNFILDTGSDVSIIDFNVLSQIKHNKIEGAEGSVYGMEGNRSKVSVCSIALSYKDNIYEDNYLVCDMKTAFSKLKKDHGVTVHGLIGSRFFCKYQYLLDFKELIAYSQK